MQCGCTRVRFACANWQSTRVASLTEVYVKNRERERERERERKRERERGEMKGEQFSRNRERLVRARARPEMKNFLYRELLSSL
jgi:hypothetical protein